MKVIKRPHHLLLIAAAVLFLLGCFSTTDTIDIHFTDTYFIFQPMHFYGLLASSLLVCWLLYVLLQKVLFSSVITWLHVILSILCMLLLAYATDRINAAAGTVADYRLWSSYSSAGNGLNGILATWVISQLLLVMNIVGGIIKLISTGRAATS